MKRLLLLVFIFVHIVTSAQITFKKQFQTPFPPVASMVLQTYDHGYIISATEESISNRTNMFVIKTNENGDTLWTKIFSNGTYGNHAQSMVQCPDSGFALIGNKNGVYLLRLNKNGDSLWGKELGSGAPSALEISQHNEFIITGSDTTLLFIRASYDGDLIIHINISIVPPGTITTQMGRSIKATYDDGSIIGGTSDWIGDSYPFLVKIDYYGNIQWINRFTYFDLGSGGSCDITKDSGFVFAGSFVYHQWDAFLLKTSFLGDTLWVNNFIAPQNQFFASVTTCKEGDYVACGGTVDSITGVNHILLTKTNQSGSLIWSRNLYSAKFLWGRCVHQTYDGGFVVLGEIQENDSSTFDLIFIKTDTSGEVSWIKNVYKAPLFTVFPNPASDFITIENHEKTKDVEVELFDLNGNCLAKSSLKPNQDKSTIYIGSIKPGEYLLKISNSTTTYLVKKIIKI